jgi:hypothetical protein
MENTSVEELTRDKALETDCHGPVALAMTSVLKRRVIAKGL